jgi:hypothetical protein
MSNLAKITKIDQAEKYIAEGDIPKGLKIYKEVCLSPNIGIDERFIALVSLYANLVEEGIDMLSRWRDMMSFVYEEELDDLIKLLAKITSVPGVNSHQRIYTAVSLYNQGHIDVCYKCFAELANDSTLLVDHQVEACRYLVCSENNDYKALAQECLATIIETMNYPSEYRYNVIAGFISRCGIATLLNSKKLKVPYDEEFVYYLQRIFFNNQTNGVRERILSGQHMIDMKCIDEEEKKNIIDELLKIATTTTYDENTRADAADVVLRLGKDETRQKAHEIIVELGYSAIDTSKGSSLISRIKTVYANSQNVHDTKISESVMNFIEKMVKTSSQKIPPYTEVHSEISELVRSCKLKPTERVAVYKALNRVSVDTAKFSSHNVTIAEILIHVWLKVCSFDDKKRTASEKRLVEELIDMGAEGGSCSTGHAARFVNVLSEEAEIRISFESQILANLAGRMNARIRDVPDVNLKVSLSLGMMENADPEDKKLYESFIFKNLIDLQKELEKEFVGEGYMKQKDFDMCFANSQRQFIK